MIRAAKALEARMVPATADEASRLVAMVVAGYPERGQDADMARARVQGFLVALDGLPGWSITEGVRAILKGETGLNAAFCPSPAELRNVCGREFYRVKALADDLRRTAAAEDGEKPMPEAERSDMHAKLTAVLAEMNLRLAKHERPKIDKTLIVKHDATPSQEPSK